MKGSTWQGGPACPSKVLSHQDTVEALGLEGQKGESRQGERTSPEGEAEKEGWTRDQGQSLCPSQVSSEQVRGWDFPCPPQLFPWTSLWPRANIRQESPHPGNQSRVTWTRLTGS